MFSILHNDWTNRARPQLGWTPDLSHPLMQGCVLEMPFIEGAGRITRDYSGKGNHGTLAGTGKKWGDSLGLTNATTSSGIVGVPDVLSTHDYTAYFILSINSNSTSGGDTRLITNGKTITQLTSGPSITTANDGASLISATGVYAYRKIFNLAITRKANTCSIYSNNYRVAFGNAGTPTIGTESFTLLNRAGLDREMYGICGLIRIYNRALSTDEIKEQHLYPFKAYVPAINRTFFAPLLLFGGVDPLYMSFAMTGGSEMSAILQRRREIGVSLTGGGALAVTTQRKRDIQVALTGSSAFSFRIDDYVDYRIPFNIRRSVVRSSLRAPVGKSLLRVPVLKSNLKAVKI